MKTFLLGSTARSYPKLPYERIKTDILGSKYELSLTFVGTARAQQLNQTYRQKDYVPNVLSFPLTKTQGEVYITPAVAKKEAAKFSLSYQGYVGFLFIHGLLHLSGLDHGPKMEKLEQQYLKKYRLT